MDPITLVNVFTVAPEKVDSFLKAWRDRGRFLSAQPGFRSLRVLRAASAGVDFQVVVVVEWDSVEALHEAADQRQYQEGARRVVEQFNVVAYPGIYRTAWEIVAGYSVS